MRLVLNGKKERIIFGQIVRPGEEFEVPDKEGQTWKTFGWARESVDEPSKRGRRKYPTEEVPEYQRRDMRAEDK